MKVVYIIDHLRSDGTQQFLTQLVKGLSARGHEQAVICLNDSYDQPVVEKLAGSNCEVHVIGKRALLAGYGLVGTMRWMRQAGFDAAVTLLFYSDVIGRLMARMVRVPWIITSLRARNIDYAGWQRWLVRRSMYRVNRVVINSEGIRDFAIKVEAARPDRIVRIPNGISIDAHDCSEDRLAILEELQLDTRTILIGAAGRLTYQKGFDILINAFALLQLPHVHLLIMGKGEQEHILSDLARKLNVAQRVHFLGYRNDLPRILCALSLYVQPSRFEGMPNALMEAIAVGCPVVVSAVDGNLELVRGGDTGWTVPAGDPEELKNTLLSALNDPVEARSRAQRAKTYLAENYSLANMISAWEEVLASRGCKY